MVLDPSFPEPEMPRTARALADGDLSRWMHWLLTAHVRRYQRHYHATGHVWQGRFKAFPIQDDDHLLVVLRYVERISLHAGLVGRAEAWEWSSLHGHAQGPWPSGWIPNRSPAARSGWRR